jgi:TRAP-type C4-dicarboxylate transport system permease small subunit
VVGVLAMAAAVSSTALAERMRRISRCVNPISGVLLVLVGAYVAYYGYYEIRLFSRGGTAGDPVISAAVRIQGALAGWVYRSGALPWIVALAGLAAVLIWWRYVKRRASASDSPASDRARAADGP